MGFDRRTMRAKRTAKTAADTVERRSTDAQLLEDAERLERAPSQARMPMLSSPTMGVAGAAVTSLIPALSCRSCRPNAPFAELVRPSQTSIAGENEDRAYRGGCLATSALREAAPRRNAFRWAV